MNPSTVRPLRTGNRYAALLQWPGAQAASGASATLERLNGDFVVPDVEKNGDSTAFVAQRLDEAAGVEERDVGYGGLQVR